MHGFLTNRGHSLPYHLLVPTGSIVGPCFLIMYVTCPLLAGIPIIRGFWNYARMRNQIIWLSAR